VSSDPDGLLSLLEIHGAELHALFTRLTLRASAADDLLQELFLKLRASIGFAKARNRKAYLFKTAVNLAFDWRRGQRPTESLQGELVVTADTPLDRLINAEEFEHVVAAMQSLPELGRQVIVLRYLQQKEYAEIAVLVGKTEHQVRALAAKALGQLQSKLRPQIG
jgi:RNA polymerase sigma factor (sigma-70 family)